MNHFFLKTLAHLGFQLTLTAITANNMRNTKINRKWMWFLISIGFLFAMRFTQIPMMIRLIMFCLFTIFNGFILSSFLKFSTPKQIQSAIFYTIFMFTVMTIVGLLLMKYDIDITPLIMLISMYSVSMLFIYFYMIIFDVEERTKQYIKIASIALFSLYIVFDTYNNFDKDYKNDIVISTLDYYTDVFSIFQNVLSMMETL